MKLTSLQLDTPFNGLQPFPKQEFAYFPDKKNIIEPICLVGPNGSGKSNFLELLSEIFFFVEKEARFERKDDRKTEKKYVIEYLMFDSTGNESKIKIDSTRDRKWRMFLHTQEDAWDDITNDYEKVLQYLPNKIVGYTSGLNETLSFRFSQINAEYAEVIRDSGMNKSNVSIPDKRLIFIDYESNASILVANFLMKPEIDLNVFKNNIRVEGLHYFKINLDFQISGGRYVDLTNEHVSIIEKLKSCATTYQIITDEKKGTLQYYSCIFEFIVNDATKNAFRFNFDSAYELFMSLQKFELLNNLKLKRKYRYISGKGAEQKPPTVGFDDKIFRLEGIQVIINSPKKNIPYIGLSDGEHQFIEVVGSIMLFDQPNILFLYDEPETHFNPQWRSKLIKIINETTKDRYQEMIQTTHSPFVVSDCKGYNVYKFYRNQNEVNFSSIDFETYGASILIILKEIFGKNNLISELARDEIEEALKSDNLDDLLNLYEELAESSDRDLLLEKINKLSSKS